MRQWEEEKISYTSKFKMDKRWKRKIAKFGPFHLWESIRVVQYKETDAPEFRYNRGVGIPDRYGFESSITRIYQRWLNFFLKKEIKVKDVRTSKYIDKYPFVGKLFKSVIRNKKLEQLGI